MGIPVSLELFIALVALSEQLLPGESMARRRRQTFVGFLIDLKEVFRNRLSPDRLGQRTVVTGRLKHTDLVLHLHHHHGLFLAVNVADMTDQTGEHRAVSPEEILRECRDDLLRPSALAAGTWETVEVALDPQWCIAAH